MTGLVDLIYKQTTFDPERYASRAQEGERVYTTKDFLTSEETRQTSPP
jgi:hypothetical protein